MDFISLYQELIETHRKLAAYMPTIITNDDRKKYLAMLYHYRTLVSDVGKIMNTQIDRAIEKTISHIE